MKALKALKNTLSIKEKDWLGDVDKVKGIVFIVLNVNEITSYLLYQLLFRLENVKVGGGEAEISLVDTGDVVKERDIVLGMFVEEDRGKNKVDVLIERYADVFTVRMFKIEDMRMFEKELEIDRRGKVILGFGKDSDESDKLFRVLYEGRLTKGEKGRIVRMQGYSYQSKAIVHTAVYGTDGVIYGDRELEQVGTEKMSAEQAVIEGQMVAGTMMMVLNTLITSDKEVAGNKYSKVEISMETGEQSNERYKKRTDIISSRGQMGVLYKYNVDVEEVDKYNTEFKDTLRKVRKDKFENKSRAGIIVDRYKTIWKPLFTDKLEELSKGKMFMYEKTMINDVGILLALIAASKGVEEGYAVVKMVDKRFNVTDFIR